MEGGLLDHFMLSPLVTWVRMFVPHDRGAQLDFSELLDGVMLNDVMMEINPSATPQAATVASGDAGQRTHNLNVVVQQIKTFYLDNLRQLILIPLPDVLLLGRNPYCEQSLEEMKKLLLLLLGCAVQCEKKDEHIARIQTLDFETKAAIAVHIQELTHSQENMLDLHWLESSEAHPDELEVVARSMATHLRHLLDQRDVHLETIAELMQEREGLTSSLGSLQSGSSAPNIQQLAGTQQHLAVELADSKAKVRRLRQELEEKSEHMLDCRHEMDNMEAELKRIQQENSQLLRDARAARTYRDEVDALRERAIRADKLESEAGRYREQLHKMEFYKAKVEELKEDNRVLQETKEVLEDQLEGWRARSDKVHQLEKHGLLLKARMHDMEQEREEDRQRIEELQGENLALCLAQRRSMDESQLLGWELEQLSKTTKSSQGQQTLSEEVNERTHSRMLRLEKENQSLLRTVRELRGSSVTSGGVSVADRRSSLEVPQTSCRPPENHTDGSQQRSTQEQILHGDSKAAQHMIVFGDELNFHSQEAGEMNNRGDSSNCLMSELEILENDLNRRRSTAVSSGDTPPDSNSSPLTRASYSDKHTQRLEAKCRAMDTFNQHLQASLDTTARKVRQLEAEVQELEAENQSLQATLEELRISARRLEQLETEKQSLEQETSALEREKRQLEKENRRLRQQAEIQESNLDSSNVCMASLEREMRLLVKEVEALREAAERVKSLEGDNRELCKQAAIDHKTLSTLREELVSEKLRSQQRDNEVQKLNHQLETNVQNQGHKTTQETSGQSGRLEVLESELVSSLNRSVQLKDDKLAAVEARLQESCDLNQQLRQELRSVKLSLEALQQRQEEEATSSTPSGGSGRTMSQWLRESQEATKELLKLKDRLIQVERNNATLEAERQGAQVQLRQLEGQWDSQQAQILVLQRQAASLQESNTALQTHNANLQVEKSTLSSQSASLLAQNAQLQQQCSQTEGERHGAIREREELRGSYEQLLRDHERLAALHERQEAECEALMGKHSCLKNAHRTLELEHRTLQDRHNNLLRQQEKLEELEKVLKEEQVRMSVEKEQHRSSTAECCRLRDEKDWLNQTHKQLLADHKQLKVELNQAKLEHTWLDADYCKLKKEFQQLDITTTKLTSQCELLSQLKGNLEEENRHLLSQIETLMLQNRTLLEQTMESKDLFHVEERQYIDKLNDLRRQKEKLEEKIMDQYKFYEPTPPRRRGNWITLKLKKLIKSSSREHGVDQPNVLDPSGPDSGSFLSSDGSGGHAPSPQPHSTLSDLEDPSAPAEEEQWAASSEELKASEADGLEEEDEEEEEVEDSISSASASSPSASIMSILHLHHPITPSSGHVTAADFADAVPEALELWLADKDSNSSAMPPGFEDNDELQSHGLDGVQSRAQSGSSGEFSLSLENEPWSNGSSPVQQLPSRCSSSSCQPPTDASTPLHALRLQHSKDKAGAHPKPNPVLPQDFWLTRGTKSIRRGSRGKMMLSSPNSGDTGKTNPGPEGVNSSLSSGKVDGEVTRASVVSPVTVLYVQGKSSSMSGCLNCFSTPLAKEGRGKRPKSPQSLPRASSVISTAEGSSRRSSVNSDCRVQAGTVESSSGAPPVVSADQETGGKKMGGAGLTPPVKPPRDPAAMLPAEHSRAPVQESLSDASFTFNSVFSNTIFSDSGLKSTTSLEALGNSEQTFQGHGSQASALDCTQTLLGTEKQQSEGPQENSAVLEKEKLLALA